MNDNEPTIDLLPSPADLERRCQALAMLDALLSAEWDSRYYSFNRAWSEPLGERVGSMRNGSGDYWFVLLQRDGGAAIKGYWHECPVLEDLTIPGALEGCPPRYASFLSEPAFSMENTTFAFWWDETGWQQSAAVTKSQRQWDGSEYLDLVVGSPEGYVEFARDYFEVDLDVEAVARFYALEPLTPTLAHAVNPGADLQALAGDIAEIGYPMAPA